MDQSACKDDGEKAGPEELLDKCWFFDNLLDRKTRMLRTLSDPSSNYSPAKSYEDTYESIKKLPSCIESDQGHNPTTKKTDPGGREKCSRSKAISSKHLLRAPSLPTSLEIQEEFAQDEEMEFSMGKLIRQASLNHSNTTRPRTRAAKATSSLSRHQSRMTPEVNSLKSNGLEKTPLTTEDSLSYLESEHLQHFKDSVFDSDSKDLNQGKISTSPGKRIEEDVGINTRSPSPEPDWGGDRSTEVMMKKHLMFWARAVASNVR